jgi:hypothetical protein
VRGKAGLWGVFLLGGCYLPATRVFRPELQGDIVSVEGARRVPLEGATVVVETWKVVTPGGGKYRLKDTVVARSDPAGHFIIPPKSERMWVGLMPDMGPAFNRRVCIYKDGYRPVVEDPWAATKPWSYRWPDAYELEPDTESRPKPPLTTEELRNRCFSDSVAGRQDNAAAEPAKP